LLPKEACSHNRLNVSESVHRVPQRLSNQFVRLDYEGVKASCRLPRNDPSSDPYTYLHCINTIGASLMHVAQPTARAPRLSALQVFPVAAFLAPTLPGSDSTMYVYCAHTAYASLTLVPRPTAHEPRLSAQLCRPSPLHRFLAAPTLPGSNTSTYVHYTHTACASLMLACPATYSLRAAFTSSVGCPPSLFRSFVVLTHDPL